MTQYDLLRLVFREHSGVLSPTQKTVLLHLIDRANKYGQCWPSQSLLSKQTGFGIRAIRQAISDLLSDGFIILISSGKGRTHSNVYGLDVDVIRQLAVGASSQTNEDIGQEEPHLGEEIGQEMPHLDKEIGQEEPHLGEEIGQEEPHLDKEIGQEVPHLDKEIGQEMPLLRQEVPLLGQEVPLTKAGGAYKEIQEEIQEDIHEEGSAQQKAKEIDPDNTGHTSEDQQRFMLPSDWKPNNHLLMEEARQRSLEGLFNLNQNYRRKMLNSFKEKYAGKKGVIKTAREWHQVFCKSIEVQLRIDGVAL